MASVAMLNSEIAQGYLPLDELRNGLRSTSQIYCGSEVGLSEHRIPLPSGKLTSSWKITIFYGKIHELSMAIFQFAFCMFTRGYLSIRWFNIMFPIVLDKKIRCIQRSIQKKIRQTQSSDSVGCIFHITIFVGLRAQLVGDVNPPYLGDKSHDLPCFWFPIPWNTTSNTLWLWLTVCHGIDGP